MVHRKTTQPPSEMMYNLELWNRFKTSFPCSVNHTLFKKSGVPSQLAVNVPNLVISHLKIRERESPSNDLENHQESLCYWRKHNSSYKTHWVLWTTLRSQNAQRWSQLYVRSITLLAVADSLSWLDFCDFRCFECSKHASTRLDRSLNWRSLSFRAECKLQMQHMNHCGQDNHTHLKRTFQLKTKSVLYTFRYVSWKECVPAPSEYGLWEWSITCQHVVKTSNNNVKLLQVDHKAMIEVLSRQSCDKSTVPS